MHPEHIEWNSEIFPSILIGYKIEVLCANRNGQQRPYDLAQFSSLLLHFRITVAQMTGSFVSNHFY